MPIDSQKSKEAEAKLPEELRPAYQQMVQDYEFLTQVKYGRGYVAYEVLAHMVLAGWRHQGCEPFHQLQPRQLDGTRPISPGLLQADHHRPIVAGLQPRLGQRWPGDVPTQALQPFAVTCTDDHAGVQAIAIAGRTLWRKAVGPPAEHL